MLIDMEGVESYEQHIDYYGEALQKIQEKVADIDQNKKRDQNVNDLEEDDYLTEQIMKNQDGNLGEEGEGYLAEYNEIISEMSRLCSIISHNNKAENKGERKIPIT